jgi:hypothetical protein
MSYCFVNVHVPGGVAGMGADHTPSIVATNTAVPSVVTVSRS